jgi:hypothetical protein
MDTKLDQLRREINLRLDKILAITIQNNIAIQAQSRLLIELFSDDDEKYEEYSKTYALFFSEVEKEVLYRLKILFGEFDLPDDLLNDQDSSEA